MVLLACQQRPAPEVAARAYLADWERADYAAMYEQVRAVLEGPSRKLLEALAEEIARRLLTEFPLLQAVTVRVGKPSAPIAGAATGTTTVEIQRARTDAP